VGSGVEPPSNQYLPPMGPRLGAMECNAKPAVVRQNRKAVCRLIIRESERPKVTTKMAAKAKARTPVRAFGK
jgi:hypothetical protein